MIIMKNMKRTLIPKGTYRCSQFAEKYKDWKKRFVFFRSFPDCYVFFGEIEVKCVNLFTSKTFNYVSYIERRIGSPVGRKYESTLKFHGPFSSKEWHE